MTSHTLNAPAADDRHLWQIEFFSKTQNGRGQLVGALYAYATSAAEMMHLAAGHYRNRAAWLSGVVFSPGRLGERGREVVEVKDIGRPLNAHAAKRVHDALAAVPTMFWLSFIGADGSYRGVYLTRAITMTDAIRATSDEAAASSAAQAVAVSLPEKFVALLPSHVFDRMLPREEAIEISKLGDGAINPTIH